MDPEGRRSRPLAPAIAVKAFAVFVAACVTLALVGAARASDGPLRAMRWLAPHADRVRALSTRPVECLAKPTDPDEAYRVEIGRAAFRTPLTLGGQAARAGVACETCHKGGRTNPDFDFPGVSGAPGTADVTSSLFSSHRGDGIDNPKPIPDLGGPKDRLKVSQARPGGALESFIHGLVTQEFDGPEPSPATLAGLAAYVRALSPAACPKAAVEAVRAEAYLEDARRAVRTASQALARGDWPTAALMLGSARSQLGLLYERYAARSLAGDRDSLMGADRQLASDAAAVRLGDPRAGSRLAAWLVLSRSWGARLVRDEPRSLFNPARIAAL